jgi:hypothetical protein
VEVVQRIVDPEGDEDWAIVGRVEAAKVGTRTSRRWRWCGWAGEVTHRAGVGGVFDGMNPIAPVAQFAQRR